jgi:uncharacterized integral membrane protein
MHDQEWSKNDGAAASESRGISPSLIIAIVAGALAVTFILQNGTDARVRGLFWTINTPMWVVIVTSMILGAILGWFAPKLMRRRDK